MWGRPMEPGGTPPNRPSNEGMKATESPVGFCVASTYARGLSAPYPDRSTATTR